jgi:folate-dependent phosphoribosylglycinamide formyltransferase PurN
MRMAILNAFPLVDRMDYKKFLIEELLKRVSDPKDLAIVYSHARLTDYYEVGIKRLGLSRSLEKIQKPTTPSTGPSAPASELPDIEHKKGSFSRIAGSLGIPVKRFHRFKDKSCTEFLQDFAPDAMINVSGQYIPKKILNTSRFGVIGGHYGLLPQMRGGDTLRWSILLDVPIYVCHMFLKTTLDMGDILSKEPVPVFRNDTIATLRRRCQFQSAKGFIHLFDLMLQNKIKRTPQRKSEGSTYYRMGKFLRDKVDTLMAEGRYSHYAENV